MQLLFTLLLGPFTFFNVQKTKLLQLFTSVMRWTTVWPVLLLHLSHLMLHFEQFLLMIIIAIIGIAGHQVCGPLLGLHSRLAQSLVPSGL
jgi:hypothetical protein